MEKIIDLHMHSTSSDGSLSPTELVRLAKEKGLCAIALTDHDTIEGLEEAINEGEKIGIEVIPGIEISASYENIEIHILGLFIDNKNDELIRFTKKLIEDREKRNKKLIKRLNELGFEITLSEVKEQSISNMIAKGHFIKVLIEKGYVKDGKEARRKYFYDNGLAAVKKNNIKPYEVIKIIKNAGGIPILAHPGDFTISYEEKKRRILELKNEGIEGIESYYYSYDDESTKFFEELANENELLVSGGSDFHGSMQPQTQIGIGSGNLRIPYSVLEKLKEYKEKNKTSHI